MIDLQRLQEAIYKYEYLIKDEKTYDSEVFAQNVFQDVLGPSENENYTFKQKYWRKNKKDGHLNLLKSELSKKYLYVLQILPFQSKIHYYCYDLQKLIEYIKKYATYGQNYSLLISIDNNYKFKICSNDDFLIEYFDDLSYHNPGNIEIPYKTLEDIQKDLLRKANLNFEEFPHNTPGEDIKINNTIVELKATRSIEKKNNNIYLIFSKTYSIKANYFILSFVFHDEKEMINIIIKNNNYKSRNTVIPISQEFVDIINDTSLSDSEKVEKLKEIKVIHKGIEYKFMSREEIFDFFNNLPATPS
ncbi:MAG: hypothetical protein QXF15_04145 [Candidatus Aenigmatarchaeota archaeon]